MKEDPPNLRSWASEVDEATLRQAEVTSRLPILAGPVALMPDAHLGKGATIGSVIPTDSAIIPSAVGVDIGCGMIAVETDRALSHLPDELDALLGDFEREVPAGLGRWHRDPTPEAREWMASHPHETLTREQEERAAVQLGTLGSGNHFLELAADERDRVWMVVHSGSRGVGNQLAMSHIAAARTQEQALEDPELGYFVQGRPEFEAYIRDMLWAQEYAMANRHALMTSALRPLLERTSGRTLTWVNCHHNYAALETHDGKQMWVTRKGAIRARRGDLGVVPGSMGSKSYITRGKGNPLSYSSSAHGAGRRMSRNRARKTVSAEEFRAAMTGRTWQAASADALVDEAPQAYKDIDRVMKDQADLVEIVHELRGILSYKGVEEPRRRRRRS